jgi:3-deoxy-D-manno-octulosonate 8-phosphate phosphatase (KDO 8-P phosphatase)
MWKAALARQGATDDEAAYVGDDLPDLAIMRTTALPVAVANAVPEIVAVCDHVLTRSGGGGAIREFAELLLRARGEWDEAVERYVAARSGADLGARA